MPATRSDRRSPAVTKGTERWRSASAILPRSEACVPCLFRQKREDNERCPSMIIGYLAGRAEGLEYKRCSSTVHPTTSLSSRARPWSYRGSAAAVRPKVARSVRSVTQAQAYEVRYGPGHRPRVMTKAVGSRGGGGAMERPRALNTPTVAGYGQAILADSNHIASSCPRSSGINPPTCADDLY
jgi:hypothetical protein